MQKTQRYNYRHLWQKWAYFLAFFVFGLIPYAVSAQSDTTKKLNEVNINTSKIPQVQTVTPLQQVNNNDFTRYSAFNVADAVRNFAGVNIKDYGGIGGLQTVSVRSLGADNTAVLYNGVQLNDAQNGEIDLSKFNLNNIQSITLYNAQPPDIFQTARAFSSANIIAIQTTRPQLLVNQPFKIVAGLKGGSFGLFNPYMEWQQRVSKYWSFVINSYDEEANGRYKYKENGDGSDTLAIRQNTDVHTQEADAELYWIKSDSDKFNLQFNVYNSSRGLPEAVIYGAAPTTQRLYNNDYSLQAGYQHIGTDGIQLLFNTKVSESLVRYTDTGGVYNIQGKIDENYRQREFYQSAAIAYHILPRWEISYSSDADVSSLFSDVYNYAFPTRLSFFNVIASNITIGKWRFQGNILNTYIHDDVENGVAASSKSAFSPTLIATYQPLNNKEFKLRAYYKKTFRNPTFAEQYYYAIAPRPLKPEYCSQYDLGAAYTRSLDGVFDFITLTADGYYNNIKDKITYIPTRSPEIPSVVNLGKVDIRGVDVVLKSQLKPFFGWKGLMSINYTYQRAIDFTDPSDSFYLDQISYTPKNTVSINAGLTHKGFGIYYNQIAATHRYDASNNTPEYYLPGYSVSDASMVYNFTIDKLPVTTSLEVNNLFNKNYVVVYAYPMPGRSLRLTFQLTI